MKLTAKKLQKIIDKGLRFRSKKEYKKFKKQARKIIRESKGKQNEKISKHI